MKRSVSIVLFLLFVLGGVSHAWDGNRKGFIAGIGLGGGQTDFGADYTGVLTNFKLGFAPSNQLLLYWHSTVVFFEDDFVEDIWIDGMGGLSAEYHFIDKPRNSLYGILGLGYHNVANTDEGDNEMGFGVRVGLGFEFLRHVSIEATLMKGFNDEPYDSMVMGVSLNVLGY